LIHGRISQLVIRKIPYHIVFDVQFYLSHKARLVPGGNWAVNETEDIYSGVVRMDTVRIGLLLGEIAWVCDIGNSFLYGKTKEKVYRVWCKFMREEFHHQ
jgi:hypothetical protein